MKKWEHQTENRTRGCRVRGANATSVLCDPPPRLLRRCFIRSTPGRTN